MAVNVPEVVFEREEVTKVFPREEVTAQERIEITPFEREEITRVYIREDQK